MLSVPAKDLASPSKAFRPLSSDVIDALITVLLALFLTFPANVFNSTFEENYVEENYRYIDTKTGRRYRRGDLTANKGGGDVEFNF